MLVSIRQESKGFTVPNTLAYDDKELFTTVKSFIMYYKTVLIRNLRKVSRFCSKLASFLVSVTNIQGPVL